MVVVLASWIDRSWSYGGTRTESKDSEGPLASIRLACPHAPSETHQNRRGLASIRLAWLGSPNLPPTMGLIDSLWMIVVP